MNKEDWDMNIDDMFADVEGNEIWDQKAIFNPKERAKMMLDTLDDEPELQRKFNLQLRQRKLNKIKK